MGVSCHFLLQGSSWPRGLKPCLFHLLNWQADSLLLHHLGSPKWYLIHHYHYHYITPAYFLSTSDSWEISSRSLHIYIYIYMLVAHSCPTLCDPMDCSPPGSSVHWILQASILEWVAIAFSRGSCQPRDWTQVSHTPGRLFTIWATGEVLKKPVL